MENKTNNSTYRQELISSLFSEKTCSVCGKRMVRAYWGGYAYKFGSKYFCSYGCMRKYEKSWPMVRAEERLNRPPLDKVKSNNGSKNR